MRWNAFSPEIDLRPCAANPGDEELSCVSASPEGDRPQLLAFPPALSQ